MPPVCATFEACVQSFVGTAMTRYMPARIPISQTARRRVEKFGQLVLLLRRDIILQTCKTIRVRLCWSDYAAARGMASLA